jgi:hypothetical protein
MVGGSTGGVGAVLANGDTTALIMIGTTPDRSSAGVGAVPVDTGGSCAVAAGAEEDMAAVVAVVPVASTAAALVVAVDASDGVVDDCRGTASETTRSASTLLVGPVPEADTDAKADAPVSFPDAIPDPADDEGPRQREATSAALAFEPVTGRVAADAWARDVCGAAGVLGVGSAAPEGADLRSLAAAVSGVVEPLRAPPVLSSTPGSAERVAACRGVDITRLVGEPVGVSVDPDLADRRDADAPDTEDSPARVASSRDELKPDGAVAFVDAEDPGADDLDAADEDESESEGVADATHGVAARPTPMPRATANPPMRPIYLAYPVVTYFALLIVVPPALLWRNDVPSTSWVEFRYRNRRPCSAGRAQ